MNGAHDLGGKQGLGPIDPEPEAEEPIFHAPWERRVFALTLATGMLGEWNIDESRHARERQHPVDYLRHSYYENWLAGLETLLVEKGLLEQGELQELQERAVNSTAAANIPLAPLRVPDAAAASKILNGGGPSSLPSVTAAKYQLGARVLAKKTHKSGHSRSPHYVQGSVGTVVDHHGSHVYPDRNACGASVAEHLYAVCFSFTSLWGAESATGTDRAEVIVDLWEPYLESAP